MNMQRVERVADFVRDAGRQKRQRMEPLALDGLKGLLPRFRRVVQDQGHARTALGFPLHGGGIHPQEPGARIGDFDFVPGRLLPPAGA